MYVFDPPLSLIHSPAILLKVSTCPSIQSTFTFSALMSKKLLKLGFHPFPSGLIPGFNDLYSLLILNSSWVSGNTISVARIIKLPVTESIGSPFSHTFSSVLSDELSEFLLLSPLSPVSPVTSTASPASPISPPPAINAICPNTSPAKCALEFLLPLSL